MPSDVHHTHNPARVAKVKLPMEKYGVSYIRLHHSGFPKTNNFTNVNFVSEMVYSSLFSVIPNPRSNKCRIALYA